MLWFQLCLVPWEAREKVRRDPALACIPHIPLPTNSWAAAKLTTFPALTQEGITIIKTKLEQLPSPDWGGGKGTSSWERLGFHSLSWQT